MMIRYLLASSGSSTTLLTCSIRLYLNFCIIIFKNIIEDSPIPILVKDRGPYAKRSLCEDISRKMRIRRVKPI